jgi:hypothetical protein
MEQAAEHGVTPRQAELFGRNRELLKRISERAIASAAEMAGVNIPVKRPTLPEDPELRGAVRKVLKQPPGLQFDASSLGLDPDYLAANSDDINIYVKEVYSDHEFTDVPRNPLGGGPGIFALGEVNPPSAFPPQPSDIA